MMLMRLIFRAIRSGLKSSRKAPFSDNQPINYQPAYKIKAQPEAVLKDLIDDLPSARVKYIIDGDTIIITKDWSDIKIRLDSIDCPEDGQHWGDIAKYGLIKLIYRQKVRIEEHGLDKHGRTLATIYIRHKITNEWLNVNERMVMLGHAWVMRMFYEHLPEDRQNKLNLLENWAKSKKIGLWQNANPIPPWTWRGG